MQPHIGQFTTYLIDLDGVVYRGEDLLAGAKSSSIGSTAIEKSFFSFPPTILLLAKSRSRRS